MADRVKINTESLLNIELPFIKVPYEQLRRLNKLCQKHIERDGAYLHTALDKVAQDHLKQTRLADLDAIIARAAGLQVKLTDLHAQEASYVASSRARLDYLQHVADMATADDPRWREYTQGRLVRMTIDYLLRKNCVAAARLLAQETGLEALVDLALFDEMQRIEAGLARGSCAEGLQWCSENRSALKKIKSRLEFFLRLQEYIELIKQRKYMDAHAYARKWLVLWRDEHMQEIEHAMGLLACPVATTTCRLYQAMLAPEQWQVLRDEFRANCYALHSMAEQAPLVLTLQAGLTALKTPHCGHPGDIHVNCPVCRTQTLGTLAQ
ncbi:hypothetical protein CAUPRSCDRAFT_7606, partial [Caulochytrium protostelioides]